MSTVNYLNAYKENQVLTADPGTILVMLYRAAIDSLKRATSSLEAGDMAEKGKWLLRACDIIAEFQSSLDFEVGGEVAINLSRLYSFMMEQITLGNVKNDAQALETVISLLSTLNEAWEEAIISGKKKVAQGGV